MRFSTKSLALWGLFFLAGCSSLQPNAKTNNQSTTSDRLKLQMEKTWVRPTTATTDVGYRKNVRMSPIILKDRILQGNAFDGIVAVNRENGQILWRFPVVGGVEGGAAVIKDKVFFGGNDGYFYSVSVSTGLMLWKTPARAETLSAPVVEDGLVYFLTGNNVLYALDATDGREVWLYSRVDSQNLSIRGASSPLVKNGVLFLGFSDGYLVALDARSGGLRWEIALNKNKRFRDVDSAPVVDGEYLYVTGYDSHLYCVNLQSGDLVWKSEPGGFGSVLIKGDFLFYASSNGQVLGLNKKDGSQVWKYQLSEGIATAPVLFGDHVVFGESNGALKVLRFKDGVGIGTMSPGHGIFSPIAVDQEKNELYFSSNSALLYKIKASWFNEREQFPWLL